MESSFPNSSRTNNCAVFGLESPSFKAIKLNLPTIEEQKKIANFLSSIDKQIDLVSTQIENTKDFKKGLLQQMFV